VIAPRAVRTVTFAPSTTPIPAAVSGDPGRLRQILLNLLGNAIKHSPKGKAVHITTHTETEQESARQMAIVEVMDEGPGVKENGFFFVQSLRFHCLRSLEEAELTYNLSEKGKGKYRSRKQMGGTRGGRARGRRILVRGAVVPREGK